MPGLHVCDSILIRGFAGTTPAKLFAWSFETQIRHIMQYNECQFSKKIDFALTFAARRSNSDVPFTFAARMDPYGKIVFTRQPTHTSKRIQTNWISW